MLPGNYIVTNYNKDNGIKAYTSSNAEIVLVPTTSYGFKDLSFGAIVKLTHKPSNLSHDLAQSAVFLQSQGMMFQGSRRIYGLNGQ